MDKKPIVNKTIKTIVPIKGNLLEKIKNKLKHNGSNSSTSETKQSSSQKSIDAINNNKQESTKTQKLVVNKRTSKIEIQKIEKVNLEIDDLIKATKSEPLKTGRNTLIREASPKPLNKTPERIIENDPELPVIEASFTIPVIRENDMIQEIILNDHPCSSKSMCSNNIQQQTTEEIMKEEKSSENVSKDDEMINNNVSEEEDEGELMDIGDEAWLHDINVMIGKHRIQEIDKSLKKIPTTVTGNRIQTENVELKLIINHLLGKLKANSVIETVQESSSSFLNNVKDSEVDYSDSYDDMPTDFNDESSDVDSIRQTKDSTIKTETSVDVNQFSVPVENSVAIITIPAINEAVIKPSATDKSIKKDVPEKIADVSTQPTKKRRGRQPLAASTAKKTKLSPTKNIKDELSDPPRRYNFRQSSRESSVESNKDASIAKSVTLPTPRERRMTRSSSRENLVKLAVEKDIETKNKTTTINNKKVTRVQELKGNKKESSAVLKRSVTSSESSLSSSDCENDKKGRGRPSRKAKIQRESSQKITNYFKKEPAIVTESIEITSKINFKNDTKKSSKENLSKINDENSSNNEKSSNEERINGRRMSTITRQKHQPKNETNVISNHPICADLKNIVDKSKDLDPTYLKPPETAKRPYLRTSAFKGNHINSDDSSNHTDSSTTKLPSVSCDDHSFSTNDSENNKKNGLQNASNLGIKDRMKELIEKQKDKINSVPILNETPLTVDQQSTSKQKNEKNKGKSPKLETISKMSSSFKGFRKKTIDTSNKKIFKQEVVEKPIEKLVCYEEILEAIRITDPSRKNGRASSAIKPLETAKKRELAKQLKSLEHFKCGSCNNLVTKHKWKDHLAEHGGMAWIDTFESPIDINNWNESVRRLNNYMRIYKFESYQCPACGCDKKSALGHLSHIYICGESDETIEARKHACEFCSEKVLPYMMSWHKRKCTVIINNKVTSNHPDDGDDEDDEEVDDENSKSSSIQDSGRTKRKAGKKAVRKVKSFLKELNEDPMDQILATRNGQFICNHCSEKFDVKEKAIEHLDKAHADQKEGVDFEASSSDASVNENESSETEGSSGVESSDIQSANEDDENDNEISESNNVSHSKGRKSNNDSQEIKNGRRVLGPYAESYHGVKISTKCIKLTKEFINDNLCDILTEFSPKYKICVSANLASYLMDLKIDTKSMKFITSLKDNYCLEYGKESNQEWNQLDFGNCIADKNSLTLFCGGSVSSLDWSQTADNKSYLAVACNSTKDKNTDLEETSKTCIQVYQLENLVNEKFTSFTNTSKFLYFFTINEGPVWSIKFHPFIKPSNERIGLLAVTSSNHHIYVYSLPYLKNDTDSPKIISLDPVFCCKTVDDVWLFQDKYLMQATVVNWFYRKDCDLHLLGAGFINGMISIWKISDFEKPENDEDLTLFPYMVFQPHREPITAIDFKYMLGSEIQLLTTSLDRDVKVFIIENSNFHETSSYYSNSRILCGEWWQHWPGFVTGNDNCYSHGNLVHRQPLEFGIRHNYLFYCVSSITTLSLNNWLNVAVFSTDAGDVLMSNPSQLMSCHPKDKWTYFGNNILSYTDIVDLQPNSNNDEHGIVFYDLKSKVSKRPKEFRSPPSSENINQLQINQISFNRSEMSYRFYALAYETGFVRIRHLKNFK